MLAISMNIIKQRGSLDIKVDGRQRGGNSATENLRMQ
jgi:hypothetical protein